MTDSAPSAGLPSRERRAPVKVEVLGPVVADPREVLLSKPAIAAATVLALATAAALVPGLDPIGLFERQEPAPATAPAPMQSSALTVGEAKLESETQPRPELEQPEHVELPRATRGPIAERLDDAPLPQVDAKAPPVPILDPDGHSLDGFYTALSATNRKVVKAVTRVAHFGDSIVVSDLVSGTLRRRLQDEFGDAGHGFVLIADAWPAYHHNDVWRWASRGWSVSRVVGPLAGDGLYGLGGVSFKAPPGVRSRFGTATEGKYGRSVSRFIVAYQEQPGGGTLTLSVDGKAARVIETNSTDKHFASAEIEVEEGQHQLELLTGGTGMVRAFGVVLERQGPGVVLDALGIQGARIRFLDKHDDDHWAEQLRWRRPDLIIYQFGANESADGFAYPMSEYHDTMKAVLVQSKRALPEAGCLIVGAMDRAHKVDDSLRTLPIIPLIVERQRAVAAEVGCAFFDTYAAMGAENSMARWVRRGLGQADMTHPSAVGAEVLGNWLYQALMQGYREFAAHSTRPR